MDKTTKNVLVFLAKMVSDFEEPTENMTAWEPISAPKEGTCETCRHIDTSRAICTYPEKFYCKLTREAHFLSHECDVPAFVREE